MDSIPKDIKKEMILVVFGGGKVSTDWRTTKILTELSKACRSIFACRMGGHGALVCGLKKPGLYKSISAFAPICNPMKCPWGQKAFSGYLGPNQESWKAYDACELVKRYDGPPLDILIDQGTSDQFYPHQLLPENLVEASKSTKVNVTLRMQEDYDHSYFFISTFVGDHVKHHAKYLKA